MGHLHARWLAILYSFCFVIDTHPQTGSDHYSITPWASSYIHVLTPYIVLCWIDTWSPSLRSSFLLRAIKRSASDPNTFHISKQNRCLRSRFSLDMLVSIMPVACGVSFVYTRFRYPAMRADMGLNKRHSCWTSLFNSVVPPLRFFVLKSNAILNVFVWTHLMQVMKETWCHKRSCEVVSFYLN